MSKRSGGIRKDRCFKVRIRMPEGATEDEVMDFIEQAVTEHRGGKIWRLDPDTVTVKRATPKYEDMRG